MIAVLVRNNTYNITNTHLKTGGNDRLFCVVIDNFFEIVMVI